MKEKLRKKILVTLFLILSVGSIFAYFYVSYDTIKGVQKYEQGREELITSKKNSVDTISELVIPQGTKIDTVVMYRIILGSFKVLGNAIKLNNSLEYSDIKQFGDYYLVTNRYFLNKKEALDSLKYYKKGSWVYCDTVLYK